MKQRMLGRIDTIKRVIGFKIPEHAFDYFCELFERGEAKHQGFYDVDVELPRRQRSTGPGSQSALFHRELGILALAQHVSLETMKQYVKYIAAIRHGYPCEVIGGLPFPQSESKASIEEESTLINTGRELAMEWGVSLEGQDAYA